MVKNRSPATEPGAPAERPAAPAKKGAGRPREIFYALEKKFTLMLPKELHRALKIKAAEHDMPMTTLIIEAIRKTYGI